MPEQPFQALLNFGEADVRALAVLSQALPICVTWLDAARQVQFASQACWQLWGEEPPAALARCAAFPANAGKCHWQTDGFDGGSEYYDILLMTNGAGNTQAVVHWCRPLFDEQGNFRGRLGIFVQQAMWRLAAEELEIYHSEHRALYDALAALNAARSLEEGFEIALESILEVLNADRAALLLFDGDVTGPYFVAWRGLSETYRRRVEGHSPWGREEINAQPIWISDVREADLQPELRAWVLAEGIRAIGFVPLAGDDELLGKFMVYYDQPHQWGAVERYHAQLLADHLAAAIGRWRAENALRESEARYRDLLDNLHDVVGLHDLEGHFLSLNAAGRRALALPPDAPLPVVRATDLLVPEARHLFDDYIARLKQKGFAEGLARALLPDGRERLWEYRSTLREDAHRPVVRFFAHDVTEREEALRALKASEARFRSLAERSFAAIYVIVDGKFVYVNKALEEITGYTHDELIGMDVAQVLHPEVRNTVLARGRARLAGLSPPPQYETRIVRKDGQHRWVLLGTGLSVWEGNAALVGSVVDITERKWQERVLQAEVNISWTAARAREGNERALLEKAVAEAQNIVPQAARVGIFLKAEDGRMCLRAHRGYDALAAQGGCFSCDCPADASPAAWRPFISTDLSTVLEGVTEADYRQRGPALVAPLFVSDELIGFLVLESDGGQIFGKQDFTLLQHFASTVAVWLQHIRLGRERQQQTRELEAVSKLVAVLRGAVKLHDALEYLLDESLKVVDASAGGIMLYHPEERLLRFATTRGWFGQLCDVAAPPDKGLVGYVFTEGAKYVVQDFHTDAMVSDEERATLPAGWGGICLPLWADRQPVGVMWVAWPSEDALSAWQQRILSSFADIGASTLQRLRLHEATLRHLRWMQVLQTIAQALTSSLDLRLTFSILLEQVRALFDVDLADVLLLDENESVLTVAAASGLEETRLQEMNAMMVGAAFSREALLEQRLVVVPDLSQAAVQGEFARFVRRERLVSYVAVPLVSKGAARGVLELFRRSPLPPLSPEAMEFLELLGRYTAVAIDNARLFQRAQRAAHELRAAYDLTIMGWARALELRDRETEGHAQRVTDLTLRLARKLGVPESQLVHIRRGALLHDIGKIGVPDEILHKPGPLTPEEWEIMRQHPVLAHRMLADIDYLRPALAIPLYHHERWDGSGYPEGLKGEAIPREARIFAVVDVYDALTSDRPYRKAWPKEKALAYLREQRGKLFDPEVVDAFLEIIAETPMTPEET